MRITITYDVVKWPAKKSFTCSVCGRRGTRSRTFRQTTSPFNKNAAGQIKTYGEIWAELYAEAEAWQPQMHAGCEP